MRMLVLGAGQQGSACAFDLLQNPAVREVRLADLKPDPLPEFLAPFSGPRLIPTPVDVRDHEAVAALMRESDAAMSAIPYYFNLDLARLAVASGTHFTDLGGNTEIVLEQKQLDAEARARGVSVVPDTGLAPGMVNVLAQMGIDRLDETWLSSLLPRIVGQFFQKRTRKQAMLHAVPSALARNRDLVAIYEKHWNRHVSPGEAIYTLRGSADDLLAQARRKNELSSSWVHEKEVFL